LGTEKIHNDHIRAIGADGESETMSNEHHQLELSEEDGVTTLKMVPNPNNPRGGVVVLDEWLIEQLHGALDEIESRPPSVGLILASASDRAFVAGADLAEIQSKNDAQLFAYLERAAAAYLRITNLECPSVAVIGGSALGGGLEIAMHCDGMIAVETSGDTRPYLVGLPEAGLGLCPGWAGTQMLPARMSTGRTWKSDALPTGLFNVRVTDASLLEEAGRSWLNQHPRHRRWDVPRCLDDLSQDVLIVALDELESELPDEESAKAVIECVRSGMNHGFMTALETERRLLVSLRHTPVARERLEAFLSRQS
jgi:3-hydroxyacyl-CoA dehydrogenase/enoyl-CoA hydratase/3-hydroxybutyryl-CoA epimerase